MLIIGGSGCVILAALVVLVFIAFVVLFGLLRGFNIRVGDAEERIGDEKRRSEDNSRAENAREDYSDYLIAPALGVALAALRAACRVLAERGYAPVSAGRKILVIFAAFCHFSSSSVPRGGHDITRRRRNFLINYENRELPEKPENASESSAT